MSPIGARPARKQAALLCMSQANGAVDVSPEEVGCENMEGYVAAAPEDQGDSPTGSLLAQQHAAGRHILQVFRLRPEKAALHLITREAIVSPLLHAV